MLKEVGGVILAPRVEDTAINGVHLAPTSQPQYNKQVVTGVARLLCRECGLPSFYLKQRYWNILGSTMCSIKPPKVRLTVPEVIKKVGDEALRKERRRQKRLANERHSRRVTFSV